jgi:hypothetical protein
MLPEQGTTRSEHIFIRLSVQNKHSEFGIADRDKGKSEEIRKLVSERYTSFKAV